MNRLDPEDVLDVGECDFIKDFSGAHSLKFKELFCAEILRDTVAPFLSHVFTFLMYKLVSSPLSTRLLLVSSFRMQFRNDFLRAQVRDTYRPIFTHRE